MVPMKWATANTIVRESEKEDHTDLGRAGVVFWVRARGDPEIGERFGAKCAQCNSEHESERV
jgi:hypothetical protein